MFKQFIYGLLMSMSLFVLMVTPVYAQSSEGCAPLTNQFEQLGGGDVVKSVPTYCTVFVAFKKFFDVASYIAGSIAVLFVMIGGFQYMTAAGNEKQATTGKNTVVYALVGVIIVIMAKALVALVANFLAK